MTKRPALVPALGERRDRPQQSNLPAPGPAGPPGRAPEEGRRTDHPPPPPRQTNPPAAGQAAPGARGCQIAPAEHAAGRDAPAMKGGLGQGPQATPPEGGGEETRRDPPPLLSPHLPPLRPAGCQRRATGAPALYPPAAGGKSPLPPKGPRPPGGDAA